MEQEREQKRVFGLTRSGMFWPHCSHVLFRLGFRLRCNALPQATLHVFPPFQVKNGLPHCGQGAVFLPRAFEHFLEQNFRFSQSGASNSLEQTPQVLVTII